MRETREKRPRSLRSSLWLRFADEASACPGCRSRRLAMLDVIPVARGPKGRRVSFLTGCHDCGLLFTNPMPTQEQLDRYYADEGPYRTHKVEAAHARRLELKTRSRKAERAPRARDLLLNALAPYVAVHQPPPGAKVLDFGCGDGKILDRLQDRGWQTFGIEPSTSVAFGRHRRLTSAPQDASFDLIILHHVLEHVKDPLGVLQQLAGALREGGVLFVSLPRLDTLPQHGNLRYCIDGRKHLMCFSEACLTGLLARTGCTTIARVDARELDDALTKGKPLRLRLVARRTATPPLRPRAPLAPAVEALSQYARARGSLAARVSGVLPVRLRAALMNRARERATPRRRR
jgi:SAM-dependent methyltransferase